MENGRHNDLYTAISAESTEKGRLERLIKAKLTASRRINGYTNLIHNSDPLLNMESEISPLQSVTALCTLSCPDILELIAAAWRQNSSPPALMAS